ncbi:hypothetical protein NBRC116588_04550 [Pyruvatibacter sp. HU-CL02332]
MSPDVIRGLLAALRAHPQSMMYSGRCEYASGPAASGNESGPRIKSGDTGERNGKGRLFSRRLAGLIVRIRMNRDGLGVV